MIFPKHPESQKITILHNIIALVVGYIKGHSDDGYEMRKKAGLVIASTFPVSFFPNGKSKADVEILQIATEPLSISI